MNYLVFFKTKKQRHSNAYFCKECLTRAEALVFCFYLEESRFYRGEDVIYTNIVEGIK